MNIVFFSNYFNHHQKFIAEALYADTKGSFRFYETSKMSEERKKLGYGEDHHPDYVSFYLQADCAADADIVISGTCPETVLRQHKQKDGLLFRYSERPLKNGLELQKYFPRLIKWHFRNPPGKPIYLLCASAYATADYAKFGLFRKKAYKWGYFPEMKRYENLDAMLQKKDPHSILWCGRFLDWKHPDDAILAVKRLKDEGYRFKLRFIGMGPMQDVMEKKVQDLSIDDCVCFLGTMRPEQVRHHMEKTEIYLFTSDRQEGWGAVLNEAMNSGCAVIASHAIGSVPFMIRDGKNGFIYQSGNTDMLYERIKFLLDHPEEQQRSGKEAYATIVNEWNAEVAAERLIQLSKWILAGKKSPDLYESGPCSKAELIDDGWYCG